MCGTHSWKLSNTWIANKNISYCEDLSPGNEHNYIFFSYWLHSPTSVCSFWYKKNIKQKLLSLKSMVELWGKLVLPKGKAKKTITTIFVLLGVTPNDRHYVPLYLKQVSSSFCHRKCQQVKKIFEHVTNIRIMMMKRFGRKM